MLLHNFFSKNKAWYVTLGLLLSLSVSYSDDILVPVTVTNRTSHYLHLTLNDKSFTYVSPGTTVQTEVETSGVTIRAVYAPGQGRSGAFHETHSTTRTEYRSPGSSYSCSSNDNSTSCKESTSPSTTTTIPTSVHVDIFPENLR
ncbi:hypothetical protein HUU05_01900 [candidate division KSB1 bacterium]|nr:hypothetical protein [candidate division KSB1 bacterium]